jgi:hypothetical protein
MGPVILAVVLLHSRVIEALNITPNSSLPGTTAFESFVGGVDTFAEWACVLAILCGAVLWAWARHAGNLAVSGNGRSMVLYAGLAIAIIGSASAIANFAFSIPLGVS